MGERVWKRVGEELKYDCSAVIEGSQVGSVINTHKWEDGSHCARVVYQLWRKIALSVRSPDCNPIKNLMGKLKQKANKKVKDDNSVAVFGGVPAHFVEGLG